MPEFSKSSLDKLSTCHPDIQKVFLEVIKHFDCTITDGHRGEKEQTNAFEKGLSKKRFPFSPHNAKPSNGVDVVPYPINYEDKQRLCFFAGFVLGIAQMMDVELIWGGDWNSNTDLKDQNFFDLPHFERKVKE